MKTKVKTLTLMIIVSFLLLVQTVIAKSPSLVTKIEESDNPISSVASIQIQRDRVIGSANQDHPFMGIYAEDIKFPKAQELGYTYLYGVLITGVVPNSPAWNVRLMEDDILMEIDGKVINNYKDFDKIRKYYRAGDTVKLTIFRSGEIKVIEFTFGRRDTDSQVLDKKLKASRSSGYGGGSYIPYWIDLDMTDVNKLLNDLGLKQIQDGGMIIHGGGGKITLGKGYFIGCIGAGYIENSQRVDPNDPTYINQMVYSIGIGGVTLDKRFALSKTMIGSLGLTLGSGSHNLELMRSNGLYDWNDIIGTMYQSNNTKLNISKNYLLVHPRAELMVRLLSWLALRGEVGYLYGYATTDGWKVTGIGEDTFDFQNSPNTKMQSVTISIGPWFGF